MHLILELVLAVPPHAAWQVHGLEDRYPRVRFPRQVRDAEPRVSREALSVRSTALPCRYYDKQPRQVRDLDPLQHREQVALGQGGPRLVVASVFQTPLAYGQVVLHNCSLPLERQDRLDSPHLVSGAEG